MFTLTLCISGTGDEPPNVQSSVKPEAGCAYIFEGLPQESTKPVYVGQVDNMDNAGHFRVVEGNPHACRCAQKALENPASITVTLLSAAA